MLMKLTPGLRKFQNTFLLIIKDSVVVKFPKISLQNGFVTIGDFVLKALTLGVNPMK